MGFYFGIIHLRLDTEESSNQKNQPTNKQKKLAVSSQMTGKVATKQDRKFSDNNHSTPTKHHRKTCTHSHIQTHQQSLVGSLDVHSHMLKWEVSLPPTFPPGCCQRMPSTEPRLPSLPSNNEAPTSLCSVNKGYIWSSNRATYFSQEEWHHQRPGAEPELPPPSSSNEVPHCSWGTNGGQ